MNGYECGVCGCTPCACDKVAKRLEVLQGIEVAKIGIDVFSKVTRWRQKIIKWLWPDLHRLSDALYDYWNKS